MAFRSPKVWLWRWRRNPLRRRADVVEGWVVLGVGLLAVLAGLPVNEMPLALQVLLTLGVVVPLGPMM